MEAILKSFVRVSEIQNKVEMNPLPEKLTNLHYFGYFSLISLARIKVISGEAEASLVYIENFSFDIIKNVLMKNFAAFTNFLYYSGFAMLMNGYYKESVKLIEKNWLFMNKYRQYMSKTAKKGMIKRLMGKNL